ncbi:MAG: hypothetical protein HW383_229 [Candidatus Magasanikbacteria bacterium]|nr:hypothetical protein [Candidatus Magasanikbacteria bacterium]
MVIQRDPWLAESWGRLAQEEVGRKAEEEEKMEEELDRVLLYHKIKKEAAGHERLEKILASIEDAALEYAGTIDRGTLARLERDNGLGEKTVIDEIESADIRRRQAHNALIDDLNLLSRQFREASLDNRWRSDIGMNRDDVGAFAVAVAKLLLRERQAKTEGGEH